METGIYIRDISKWREIFAGIDREIHWAICGDYGCPKITPSSGELFQFKDELAKQNKKLYYISPKVTEAVIDEEISKILDLIKAGIRVSINDWGVLYALKSHIKPESDVYIGRLLTSSIACLAWSDVYLRKESQPVKDYLLQNNFNDQYKIAFLKEYGIRGIEVDAYHCSEKSYQKIIDQGIAIVGYADNTVLSISRACPLGRLKEVDVMKADCRELCSEKFMVTPASEKLTGIYPPMELLGNVLYQPRVKDIELNEYEIIIYFNPENIGASQKSQLIPG